MRNTVFTVVLVVVCFHTLYGSDAQLSELNQDASNRHRRSQPTYHLIDTCMRRELDNTIRGGVEVPWTYRATYFLVQTLYANCNVMSLQPEGLIACTNRTVNFEVERFGRIVADCMAVF
uniref:Uncharacterized protein n=1 Tax=Ciona intestinalis TaxID=7719 RepID=F7AJS6_CIOIN